MVDARELLREICAGIEFPFSEEQLAQLALYGEWLREWNMRFNLTAITDQRGICVKHFLDSAYALLSIEEIEPVASVLDLGSGAGFPGLVWKILRPEMRVTLCDSLLKRTQFLHFVVSGLDLQGVVIVHGRAEELAKQPEYRERYASVTARAVARLPVLIELASPFVKVGGSFHALKGPTSSEEIAESEHALGELRCRVKTVDHYVLPGDAGKRSVITITKTGLTPGRFPRRPGDAARRPISGSD